MRTLTIVLGSLLVVAILYIIFRPAKVVEKPIIQFLPDTNLINEYTALKYRISQKEDSISLYKFLLENAKKKKPPVIVYTNDSDLVEQYRTIISGLQRN